MPAALVLWHVAQCRQQKVADTLSAHQATLMAIVSALGTGGDESATSWADSLCRSVGLDPPSGLVLLYEADDLPEGMQQRVEEIEREAASRWR